MPSDDEARLLGLDLHLARLTVEVIVGEDGFFGHDLLNLGDGNLGFCQHLQVRSDHDSLAQLLG